MKFCPWIVALLWVYIGTNAQELDLFDALAPDPTPAVPVKPKPDEPKKPAGGDSGGLDLLDAFDEGPASTPEKPEKPKKPSGGGGGFELDLGDALGPDDPTPEKPAVKPPRGGGGGGSFDDSDLEELGGGGEYKPDGGRSGGSGGRAQGPGAAGDNPQDLNHLWAQILKTLYANTPDEVFIWMSNFKRVVVPLLERVMEMLDTVGQ